MKHRCLCGVATTERKMALWKLSRAREVVVIVHMEYLRQTARRQTRSGKGCLKWSLVLSSTHDRLGQGCSRAREVVVIVRMEYFRQTARRQTRSGKGCLKWTRVYGGNPRSSGSELRCKQSAITYLTSLTVLHIVCN